MERRNFFIIVLSIFLFTADIYAVELLKGYKGVNFGASVESTTAILKSQNKKFTKRIDALTKNEVLQYWDEILDRSVYIQYYFTPQTRRMYQVILTFNKAEPEGVKEILTAKYGPPSTVSNEAFKKAIWLFENGTKIILGDGNIIYLDIRLSQIAKQEVEMKGKKMEDLEGAMKDF